MEALPGAGLNVTGNRRLMFWIDDEPQICDVNLEDYH
jgi:hypothetical protein